MVRQFPRIRFRKRRLRKRFPVEVEPLEIRTVPSSVGTTHFASITDSNATVPFTIDAFNTSTTQPMAVSWMTMPIGATEGQDYSISNGSGSRLRGLLERDRRHVASFFLRFLPVFVLEAASRILNRDS
jgi:hypothetical protein